MRVHQQRSTEARGALLGSWDKKKTHSSSVIVLIVAIDCCLATIKTIKTIKQSAIKE
jgi:hypothetical protein